jgi:hypothetical protein
LLRGSGHHLLQASPDPGEVTKTQMDGERRADGDVLAAAATIIELA